MRLGADFDNVVENFVFEEVATVIHVEGLEGAKCPRQVGRCFVLAHSIILTHRVRFDLRFSSLIRESQINLLILLTL